MLEVTRGGNLTCVRDKKLGKRHYYDISAPNEYSWIMQVAICVAEDIALSCALDFLDSVRDELEPGLDCTWDEAIQMFVDNYESSGVTQTPRVELD